MQTWDRVVVTDKTLEAVGRIGTVRNAGLHDGRPVRRGNTVTMIGVLLDGDTVQIEFCANQVAPI